MSGHDQVAWIRIPHAAASEAEPSMIESGRTKANITESGVPGGKKSPRTDGRARRISHHMKTPIPCAVRYRTAARRQNSRCPISEAPAISECKLQELIGLGAAVRAHLSEIPLQFLARP